MNEGVWLRLPVNIMSSVVISTEEEVVIVVGANRTRGKFQCPRLRQLRCRTLISALWAASM